MIKVIEIIIVLIAITVILILAFGVKYGIAVMAGMLFLSAIAVWFEQGK